MIDYRKEITADLVRTLLDYDPKTGIFTWKSRPLSFFSDERGMKSWNTRCSGKTAGTKLSNGYCEIRIGRIHFYAHRLAWLWMTGSWPEHEIDHRDLNPSNNSWPNLRSATSAQNKMNSRKPIHNTSGIKGVSWSKVRQKWMATIKAHGEHHFLGYFEFPELAAVSYNIAAEALHGEYGRAS